MQKSMNTQGTDGGSVTVALPDFALEETRRQLIALRVKYGAASPKGHRCSNAIEQIQALQGATGTQREHLVKLIERTMKQLAA